VHKVLRENNVKPHQHRTFKVSRDPKFDEKVLDVNPRVKFHFTPTSASWLNQVEGLFSILTRRSLLIQRVTKVTRPPRPDHAAFLRRSRPPRRHGRCLGPRDALRLRRPRSPCRDAVRRRHARAQHLRPRGSRARRDRAGGRHDGLRPRRRGGQLLKELQDGELLGRFALTARASALLAC
jgi:hypothetical protein